MGRRFTIFCFVLLCIRGQIPITRPRGAYIPGGDLTEGYLSYDFEGLIHGGAYTWRGLFSEFNGIQPIRSTTQIWIVFRHQYGISAVVSQTSFRGKISGGVSKFRRFLKLLISES